MFCDPQRALTFSICLALFGTASAQVHQRHFELPNADAQDIHWADRTSDGGFVLGLDSDTGSVVLKCDTAGEPLWCKRFRRQGASSGPHGSVGWATSDGGVLLRAELSYNGSVISAWGYFTLIRMDAQGDPMWMKRYAIEWPLNELPIAPFVARMDQAGNTFLMISGTISSTSAIMKLDPMGDIAWLTLATDPDGEFVPDIEPDDNGGVYFVHTEFAGGPDLFACHLDANGNVAWYNRYFHDATAIHHQEIELAVLSNDDLVVTGSMNSSPFSMGLAPSGAVLWYKVNALSVPTTYVQSALSTDDELMMMAGPFFLRIDGNGDWQDVQRLTPITSGNVEHTIAPEYLIAIQDRLGAVGVHYAEDLTFGLFEYSYFIWSLPFDLIGACGFLPASVISVLNVPPGDFTVTPVSSAGSQTFAVVDTSYLQEPRPLPIMDDHCALWLTVNGPGEHHPLLLTPNVLMQGEHLRIQAPKGSRTRFFGMAGQEVLHPRLAMNENGLSIGTDGLNPGIYVVLCETDDGAQRARFVLR